MKKVVISLLLIGSLIFLSGCTDTNTDSYQFKKEYEALNNKKDENGKKYLKMKLTNTDIIQYSNEEEILELLNGKTGIIYMGHADCQECRSTVPVLLQTAKKNKLNKIYYLDISKIRDEKKLENDSIKTVKKGTEGYKKLVTRLYDFLDTYEGLHDISEKRIYGPLIIAVKEGQISSVHKNTVNSQYDFTKEMTEEEKKGLQQIYTDMIKSIK